MRARAQDAFIVAPQPAAVKVVPGALSAAEGKAMQTRSTILVVDDEAPITELLRAILAEEGYRVRTAATSAAALASIQAARPHLILLAVMMPSKHGLDLCRTLQDDSATRDIPIVLMSAAVDPSKISGCGYAAFLPLPFDIDALIALVQSFVGPGAAAAPRGQSGG
jgi:two-component system phosphate regulon response regulator PhoB